MNKLNKNTMYNEFAYTVKNSVLAKMLFPESSLRIKDFFVKIISYTALTALFLMLPASYAFAQKTWDGGGDGVSWSSANNWNPNGVPTAGQTVTINVTASETINMNGNYSCASLTLSYSGNAGSNGSLQFNVQAGNTLTVSGNVDIINTATSNFRTKSVILNVDGSLTSTGNLAFTEGNRDNKTGSLTINNTGTVNISGNLTLGNDPDRTDVTVNGAGVLNIGGNFTSGGAPFYCGSGTVNYNGSGAQNVLNTTYYNLTISGGNTKTIQGDVTVNNNLDLSNGNLSLGAGTNDLTIIDGATITGSFDNTHMIVCDDNGSVIKEGNTGTDFEMVFPVGTGTSYSPFEITSMTSTGTGNVSVRTEGIQEPNANPSDLQRYWEVDNTITVTAASIAFTYLNPADVGTGDQTKYIPYLYNGGWILPTGTSAEGVNPCTVSGTNLIAGNWTAKEAPDIVTYYSYQSGDWNTATTWTTDPSGTLSANPAVPDTDDRVIILNGRTVTVTTNGISILSTQINEGGTLDIGTSTGHDFGDVRGQGFLSLESNNFPSGSFTEFVSSSGGTVKYYNSSDFTLNQYTYNNLIFDLSGTGIVSTVSGDLTINGDLTVTTGRFQINNNVGASRTVVVYGDVNVAANGYIQLGTGNYNHTMTIYGDFINYGSVDFYEGSSADYLGTIYNTTAHADVEFVNAYADQNLVCNGYSEFYRIAIDKGTDWTYVLYITADNSSNFYLYGRNNPTQGADGTVNPKALGLTAGSVSLGENIIIGALTSDAASTNNYNINSAAQLIIDGASVSSANVPSDMLVVVYGKLAINSGTFDCTNTRASLITRSSSNVTITGGTLIATQLRTSNETGTHRGAFIMTGGTLNLITNTASLSWADNSRRHATLSFTYPDNVFKMSGGTINILGSTPRINDGGGTSGFDFSIVLGSNPENISMTGGTINVTVPTGQPAYITSTVPFWDLNVTGTNGTYDFGIRDFVATSGTPNSLDAQPLVVYNDFTLQNNATFDNATNTQDVTIGGDFTIDASSDYTPDDNITTLNGSSGQIFDNSGTIGSGGLYDLILDNASNTSISQNLTIRNDLTINSNCFLQDMGKTIGVGGNISNSGTHASQAGGGIIINNTTAQTIGGDGNGEFGNLTINKSGGTTSLTANQSLTGNLRLANGTLNLGIYNLTLGTSSNIYDALYPATSKVFSGTKMIITSGNPSDGGLSKIFNSTTAFLFPVGTSSDYTPATIQFSSAPATWGTVNVKPVDQYNPFVTSANSLDYYWKVNSTGITGIVAGSVSHTYRYVTSDIRGVEATYVPGRYFPNSWNYIDDISKVIDGSNDIQFQNVNYLEGDFTAGENTAFQSVKVFYSRQNGDWSDVNTWSSIAVGGAVDGSLPGVNNPVIIGDGAGQDHTVTITTNGIIVGSLQISDNSTLDITTTTGHNFGAIPDTKVTGTGTLRISSSVATATFPGGDFGNFLATGGGTVEYYSTGTTDFTIPNTKLYYNNLIISPSTGRYIAMPDLDVSVFDDLTISGTGTGVVRLNSVSAKTLTVDSAINVTGGTLRFMNNTNAQTLYTEDINISLGAIFDISTTTNATNKLYITGNLNNDGTFDMYGGDAARICNVYFTGDTDKTFSGTGTNDLYLLGVDKGTSRNTILSVTADNLTLNTALSLLNGTFRVSNSLLNLSLSTLNSFTIPFSAALSVSDGTVTIGTTSDNGDLILAGRLEVINNGIANIGTGGTAYNNDIEYASGGNPEIIVGGSGTLNVYGQIRRSTTITSGALIYTQSGGTVTIYGYDQATTRAKLEILNSGSEFNMSGGSIIIINGGGSASYYGDLNLTPEFYDVTGGTIQIGSGTTTTNDFQINASVPLWNLTIDGTTTNKNADIRVNNLILENDLSIMGNSVFRANGLDVTIGGDLVNNNNNSSSGVDNGGYRPGSLTQVTTFNGSGSQTISGAGTNLTNFANLVINSSETVTLATNTATRINADLLLTSGTLNDGQNVVTVIGNIENNAVHSSPSSIGGIVMEGTLRQTISGSGYGIFGNLEINNVLNVDIVDNTTINGELEITNGLLYIDDYLLTLGADATVSGSFDATKMIILNGVISDAGVRKLFNSGASNFTFPLGVAGKYTPVIYSFSANPNSGAYINVKPVNYSHPADNDADGNELAYYWNIVSSGFSSGYTVDQTFQYINDDVSGTETNYVCGRYLSGSWVPANGISGTVDDATDQIFLDDVTYLDGEYTAGEPANFTDKPTLYSRGSGDWSDPNSWSTTGHAGASCSCTPDGNPVVIASGHTITLDSDGAEAYSVDLEGVLEIGTTVFHNLGHVSGGGKINLTSTIDGIFVFPGGEYDEFMANPSSTIEFTGTNTASLPLKPGNNYKPYQNVIFSGTGIKQISAEDLKVMGNLTINDPTVLDNTLFNRSITILGNWTDNNTSSTGGFDPGTGEVIFNGTSSQTMTITGGSVTSQFYDLEIDNSSGVVLAGGGQIDLQGRLTLSTGNLTTNYTNLLTISNSSTNAINGGGANSFVDGPLRKRITSGSYFSYPIGDNDGSRYGNAYISSVSTTGYYIFEYINHNPGDEGYDPNSVANPIDVVSDIEYWHANGPTGATANVRIRWDDQSGIIPPSAIGRTKLRVVEWNGSEWENRGDIVNDGGVSSGTIQTNPVVDVGGDHYFTIGVESLPTATITSGDASICDDGSSTNITIDLTGTAPWSIRYMINGANETTINNIASSPYNLVVSNAIEPLASNGPGDYDFNVSYIRDATGSTGIRDFTTTVTITLNESPNPVISGNTTVAINENNVIYSTPLVSGHTYLWSYSGPTGTTHNGVLTNNTLNMHWGSVAGTGWVSVTETATSGGCSTATTQYNVTITDIPNPEITGPDPVCYDDTAVYRTAIVGTHTYSWSLPTGGGNILGPSDLDSVIVNWTSVGDYSVEVEETGSTPVSDNYPVTVNPLPDNSNVVTDPTICEGDEADIIVESTAGGITYQLRLDSDDSYVGLSVSSGPGGDITLNASPTVSTIYNVLASNEYGCSVELSDLSNVSVDPLPTVNAGSDEETCEGTDFDLSSSTTPPTATNYNSLLWTTSGTGSFDNNTLLLPVYTPSTVDRDAGGVTLTLTAEGIGACSDINDDMILTITTAPSANAGSDEEICAGSTFDLSTSTTVPSAGDYADLLWTTSGTGSFDDNTSLTPVYDPSAADEASGSVTLTLTADPNGSCIAASDDMVLTITASPIVNAGSDEETCEGSAFDLSTSTTAPTASNYADLLWTTSGTGSFDDNTSLTPVYTPSTADETAGSVTLTLTANPNGSCSAANDDMVLTINPLPTPSVTGNTDVCETETHTYSTTATGNNFVWTVTGGTIDSGQGTNQVTVTWNTLLPVGTLSAARTVEVEETDAVTSCQDTSLLNVTVHRIPVTGPVNHIDQGLYP